jgi:hypothetical protein
MKTLAVRGIANHLLRHYAIYLRYMASNATCSIRVSTRAFDRIWRIERKPECLKFFVFNNQQWCESHPLRHNKFFTVQYVTVTPVFTVPACTSGLRHVGGFFTRSAQNLRDVSDFVTVTFDANQRPTKGRCNHERRSCLVRCCPPSAARCRKRRASNENLAA